MARSPAQYGKATYDGAILEYQTCQTDVAGWALEHTETDPDLLQFPEYAYNFMYQTVKEKRLSPVQPYGSSSLRLFILIISKVS